jgi:hypothetical protein
MSITAKRKLNRNVESIMDINNNTNNFKDKFYFEFEKTPEERLFIQKAENDKSIFYNFLKFFFIFLDSKKYFTEQMYGNSMLLNSDKSPIKINSKQQKPQNKEDSFTIKSNLKDIDLLSYKDISKDPKMASYIIGANLLGESHKKNLDFNYNTNPLFDERNLFSPNKTNFKRNSSRQQSTNNISMSYRNYDEISNLSKNTEKKQRNNLENNEKVSSKQLMNDIEQDFKSIFNRTKKNLSNKNDIFEKINNGEKPKAQIISDIHIENKNKYIHNLNSVDFNLEFNEDLSNKITKFELLKKMKTKFKDINTMTERMKSITDNNKEKDYVNIKKKENEVSKDKKITNENLNLNKSKYFILSYLI